MFKIKAVYKELREWLEPTFNLKICSTNDIIYVFTYKNPMCLEIYCHESLCAAIYDLLHDGYAEYDLIDIMPQSLINRLIFEEQTVYSKAILKRIYETRNF